MGLRIIAQKTIIRSSFPPHIADRMCDAIDGQEKMERFMRLLNEYNERRCRFRSKTGWTTLAATMFGCDCIEMEAE